MFLCNTSGDKYPLGGVKFPITSSSEHQLAPCHWDSADILKMTSWLEALRRDFFFFFLLSPFHALKCNRFIKTLRQSHKRTSYYFTRVTEKESKNKISSLLLGSSHFMQLCDLTSQEIPREAVQAGRKLRSRSSRFWTCA